MEPDKQVPFKLKDKFDRTVVRSALLYGPESRKMDVGIGEIGGESFQER